jgi:hypothetical protein
MWQIFIYLSCSASRGTPDKGEDVLWGRLLLRLIYAPRLGEAQHSVAWKYRGFRGQVPAQTPMIVWSHKYCDPLIRRPTPGIFSTAWKQLAWHSVYFLVGTLDVKESEDHGQW